MIKSPLRYPGGKSRAIETIAARLPHGFREFREPFVGGGSLFCYVRQTFPTIPCWINDLNPDLIHFYLEAQEDVSLLVDTLHELRNRETDGRALFYRLRGVDKETLSPLERAVRFFALNRITFSGTIESGGYSQGAFQGRWTHSAIERVRRLAPLLQDVTITNADYEASLCQLSSTNNEVFIFLDPPYLSTTRSRLYGERDTLHTGFDHERFARLVTESPHLWMITYDDISELRERFADFRQHRWKLQYGMNNVSTETAPATSTDTHANYTA